MKKKMVAIIMTAALAVLPLVGCTEQTGEAEADAGAVYEVVGGISEPTREWNEVSTDNVEAEAEAPATDGEAYAPNVLAMEPTAFVANKVADILTSDKDGEVVRTLAEGEEITLVGTTGKGYYQTEDGAFISASDVEKVVIEEQVAETETKPTTTQNNTTPTTTTTPTSTTTESAPAAQESQPTQEQPTQQESQPVQEEQAPVQEQTPVAEQETPAPAPEPTPAPEPQPTQEVPVTNTIVCDMCGATFATEEECVAHLYAAHVEDPTPSAIGCAHPNAWEDENGMLYCPDCGGYVSHY